MADTEQVREAAEAYIYGYPLVYDLQEVADLVEGGGSLPLQAPPITPSATRAGCSARRPSSSRPTTTPCT